VSETLAAEFAAELLGEYSDPASGEPENPNPNPQGEQPSAEPQEPKGEEPTEPNGEGEVPDPLENLSIEDLLKHPKLASKVNSYADRVANNRIQAEVQSKLAEQEVSIRDDLLDKYFSSLDETELGQVLAKDKNLAKEYGRLQEKAEPQGQFMTADQISQQAQIEASRLTIRTNTSLIVDSDLPDDIKQTLNPQNYVSQGMAGLTTWTQDIYKALAKHEASKSAKDMFREELEAERNRQRAEKDEALPGASMTKGRVMQTLTDLFSTSSAQLLEDAFAKRGTK